MYSYAPDENDSVTDPFLAEHLAKLGINAMQLQKTEKTVTELQIALNSTFEFDHITESGRELVPLSGEPQRTWLRHPCTHPLTWGASHSAETDTQASTHSLGEPLTEPRQTLTHARTHSLGTWGASH